MTPLDQYKRYYAELLDLDDLANLTHGHARRLKRVSYRKQRLAQLTAANDSVRQYRDQEHARARKALLAHPVLAPMVRNSGE